MQLSANKSYFPPGFTLVEIMVAMVITMIVMGGVYQTLSDENVNHDRSEKILDMQNNARVALGRISRDVRRTGSLGCGGTLKASTLSHSVTTDTTFIQDLTLNPASPSALHWPADHSILDTLLGNMAGTDVNLLSEVMGFSDNVAPGHGLYQESTDVLTLVYLSDERVLASAMGTAVNAPISLKANGFSDGDILYITDCEDYSLFKASSVTISTDPVVTPPTVLHATDNLKKNYGDQSTARLFKLNTATYFIKSGGDFTLYYNADNAPLADNIEDLQFEFLADENGNGNLGDEVWRTNLATYSSARAVRVVRIWVLAMSEPDYSYTNNENYDYPNSPYCSAVSTFTCRNKGTPASLALASPTNGKNRHRYLASAVVYLRNAALK